MYMYTCRCVCLHVHVDGIGRLSPFSKREIILLLFNYIYQLNGSLDRSQITVDDVVGKVLCVCVCVGRGGEVEDMIMFPLSHQALLEA